MYAGNSHFLENKTVEKHTFEKHTFQNDKQMKSFERKKILIPFRRHSLEMLCFVWKCCSTADDENWGYVTIMNMTFNIAMCQKRFSKYWCGEFRKCVGFQIFVR